MTTENTMNTITAAASGTWRLGDRTVNRLGFGAMRTMSRSNGEPSDRTGLGQNKRARIREKCCDLFFLTRLCLQLNIKCETGHQRTPLSLWVSVNM